jgi:DNA-binding MarR family transcriptional regulator
VKKPANAQHVLDLAIAVIELQFRLEAATQAIVGFAHAGGEFGILRMLVLDGPQTVPEMARSRPVSRQHCQIITNGLEAQGYVEFIENPKHKRSHLVRATRAGRAHYERMTKQLLAAAGVYAQSFNAAEVETATDVCRRARELIVV